MGILTANIGRPLSDSKVVEFNHLNLRGFEDAFGQSDFAGTEVLDCLKFKRLKSTTFEVVLGA